MINTQILKIYFQAQLPAGLSWELGDDTGTLATGALSSPVSDLSVQVPSTADRKHEYMIMFRDADDVPYPHAKLDYAEGGVIIVVNLDIHENDTTLSTKTAISEKGSAGLKA